MSNYNKCSRNLFQLSAVVMAIILLLFCGTTAFAEDIAAPSDPNESDVNVISDEAVLLDTVILVTDKDGVTQEVNGLSRGWVDQNVVTRFDFYDVGIRNNTHYYEVHMSSYVYDSYYYYTYHKMQIKPSTNTNWWSQPTTHNTVDHKTSVSDSMGYNYPVGSEPSVLKVKAKCSFTIQNYGSFDLPEVTLTNPMAL